MLHRLIRIALLPVALVAASPAFAGELEVPVPLLAKLTMKALAYDQGMGTRNASAVPVAVLYAPGNGESADVAGGISDTIRGSIATFNGKPVSVNKLAFAGAGDLAAKLGADKTSVLYVCPGLSGQLDGILGVTRKLGIASVATLGEDVGRGVNLGVAVANGRPKLLVNLRSAKAEGSDFSATLLQLADVIR